MTRGRIRRALAMQGAVWLLLLGIFGLTAPTVMAAEGERVFDPQLSLIGGCKEEASDTIQDPGCPYLPPPDGPTPPSFANPRAVATDFYGNIYVSNFGKKEDGSEGRIDIFDSEGFFITELKLIRPTSLAIDSKGYLYVTQQVGTDFSILRFKPCAPYEPEAGKIDYCEPPFIVPDAGNPSHAGLSINQDNDHLFANYGSLKVIEHGSAEEGNPIIRKTEAVIGPGGTGVAVDAARDRLYASAGLNEERIDIFDLTSVVGTPPDDEYEKVGSIEKSQVPANDFGVGLSVAIDEATSHVFVLDGENCHLYEFDENDEFVREIEETSSRFQCTAGLEIGVDNGPFSPNGALSTKGSYLYVPSHRIGTGHSFAFFESKVGKPEVISLDAVNITESEAELQSVVNPHNLPTTYRFEIKVEGAPTWTLVGEGEIPAGNLDAEVSAVAAGLEEGTAYRFRIVATNDEGSDEEEGSFATYPNIPIDPTPCANALLRTGPSALLPDCRAYELVTPPDTNGHAPLGTLRTPGAFTTRQVSPAGDKIPFNIEGGSLPGFESYGGSLVGEPYLASRTSSGWSTTYIGPSGAETVGGLPGATSPDQGHSFWLAQVSGSAVIEGGETAYVRFPDGHSELLGQGELGIDPKSLGQLISEGGGHIIFSTGLELATTAVQLEPEAAPDETQAIYDRVPNPETGVRETKVVSLKPGDVPFGAGEHAVFLGASLDGEGVGFEVDNTLYLRYDNEASFEIDEGVEFAGVAEGGRRIFYVEAGDLKAFDIDKGEIIFAETGDTVPVQVALGGSAAYFVSETAIGESGPNPQGDEPEAGKQNLYLSEEGEISFVGILTDRDVEGDFISGVGFVDGLGLWVDAIKHLGDVPARATPDGNVLLFKARAALTDYDPDGKAQIYRYDSAAGELQCLSCNPTGQAPGSDASLQSKSREGKLLFEAVAWPENLRADGRRAFFQSSEPLVARDSDELQDVYEWEDEGVGSCTRPGGCIYLISSAQSLRNEYLWAVSPSGEDVFFLSYDLLVGADTDQTPSLYDARVNGGFPEAVKPICEGEGCRPQLSPPPVLPGADTRVRDEGDNVKPRRCPKGKRKVKRHGKVICVKKKKHRKAGTKQQGGRR